MHEKLNKYIVFFMTKITYFNLFIDDILTYNVYLFNKEYLLVYDGDRHLKLTL